MPGIFFVSNMDLRLQLSVAIDDSLEPDLSAEPTVRLELWPHWLLTACDNGLLANAAEQRLHRAFAEDTDDKAPALEAELRAGLAVNSACAFAFDAFYASVVERFGEHPDAATWRRGRTPRHRQVFETLRYHFKINNQDAPQVADIIKQLFKFRDWAVHPSAKFTEPLYRPDIDVAVERRFITFSASAARKTIEASVSLMSALVEKAGRLAAGDNIQWQQGADARVDAIRAAASLIQGVALPPKPGASE